MGKIETLERNTEIINGEAVVTETVQEVMSVQDIDRKIIQIDTQIQQILQQVTGLKERYQTFELQKSEYVKIKGQLPQNENSFDL